MRCATTDANTRDGEWSDEERLGTTPELLALSEAACDCCAREDGGQGHDPDCAFYIAVAVHFGLRHPLVVGAYGVDAREDLRERVFAQEMIRLYPNSPGKVDARVMDRRRSARDG